MKRIGIWIRVSTEDQVKGESPEHHEMRARAYAQAKDWEVVEVYRLDAVSGKSAMDHPEAQRMIADIQSGHIQALIFSKLARLARNTRHLLDIADLFREAGADLVSLQESIDTSTPAGRLFYTMIAAMAQWEREEISERVAASVPVRAQMGKPLGGAAPYGYMWKDKQLVVDETEAPIRRLIYELFLEHRRKKTVARMLNEKGYRTRKGGKWSDTTIARLLRDPTAKGQRRANYTKSTGDGKKWVLKDKSDWVFSEVEPIVDETTWEQANQILDSQRSSRTKVARRSDQLFTGLLYCGCGSKMYVPSNTPKYVCYSCRNKIPIDDIEDIYQEQLKQFLLSPDQLAQYLAGADEEIQQRQAELDVLQSQKTKLEAESEKLYTLYIQGQISPQAFGKKNKPLEERLREIEETLPSLRGQIDFLKINYLSGDQTNQDAFDLYHQWMQMDRSSKRAMVEALTDRITVDKGVVSIELHYSPFLLRTDGLATQPHPCVAKLPPRHFEVQRQPEGIPKSLNTLGDHIKAARLERGLFQKDVAQALGVSAETILHWETGATIEIHPSLYPKIAMWLGYCPVTETGSTQGKRLKLTRLYKGLTKGALADMWASDTASITKWEADQGPRNLKARKLIEDFLEESN